MNNLFNQLAPFENNPTIAVAVSGGADSLALTLLANEWVKTIGGRIIALTVDHHLRPESKAEAYQVGLWLAKYNIEHHILQWDHLEKPTSNIQAKAREARYKLLTNWCQQHHILHLMLAHHQQDQAETILMRKQRGSGVIGLAGMAMVSYSKEVRLLRPFLQIKKQDLIDYLQSINQPYVEDPSNKDTKFTRIKVRKLLQSNIELNETLISTTTNRGKARHGFEISSYNHMSKSVIIYPEGYAYVKLEQFKQVQKEEAWQILTRILTTIGSLNHQPRFESIEKLYDNILYNQKTTTLGGCKIIFSTSKYMAHNLLICKEIPQNYKQQEMKFIPNLLWNNRFLITSDEDLFKMSKNNTMIVNYLGTHGFAQIKDRCKNITIPKQVLFTLPAIRDLDKVVFVPYIEYYDYDKLKNAIKCKFHPRKSLSDAYFEYS